MRATQLAPRAKRPVNTGDDGQHTFRSPVAWEVAR
jgi:hypothetical protein